MDTDFENSYGWSISGIDSLERFLRDFLFAKYPKTEQRYVHTASIVEFLTSDLALVEEANRSAREKV
jgi:superfamily I DNA/RNA helicase